MKEITPEFLKSCRKAAEHIFQLVIVCPERGSNYLMVLAADDISIGNERDGTKEDRIVGTDITEKILDKAFTDFGSPSGTNSINTYIDSKKSFEYELTGFKLIIIRPN